jgi:FKBP-type peptidyl-prolyl cis-trans isomerase
MMQSVAVAHATCSYSDYTKTDSGLQYFDLKEGNGPAPGPNSLCTVDWDGARTYGLLPSVQDYLA